jgi:hypothetical protein
VAMLINYSGAALTPQCYARSKSAAQCWLNQIEVTSCRKNACNAAWQQSFLPM